MSGPQPQADQHGREPDRRQPRSDGVRRNSGYLAALEDFRRMKDLDGQ